MATRRIVLGLDGSAGSEAARQWCIECAPLLDAEVIAVHVVDVGPLYFGPATIAALQPPIEEVSRHRAELLEEWVKPLADAGVRYRTELVDGLPAPKLDQVAINEDVALIVVGRRGMSGFDELLLGSVPTALAHHAHRPLLIVPAA
jgi:nucleotide-binding universal stress UspA family protein